MIAGIKKAKSCHLVFDSSSQKIRFCTGMQLSSSDLRDFKEWNLTQCKEQMRRQGFKIFVETRPSGLALKSYRHFLASSKKVEVNYRQAVVLLKRRAAREDCLRGILGLYQRARSTESVLSPAQRKQWETTFLTLLEEQAALVENWERKKKVREAKELAKKVKTFITLLAEWQKLGSWLEKKEVEEFFYRFGKKVKANQLSYEMALNHLLTLKDYLAWPLREVVLVDARRLLDQKYKVIPATLKAPASLEKLKEREADLETQLRSKKIGTGQFEKKVIGLRKAYWRGELGKARLRGASWQELFRLKGKLRQYDSQIPVRFFFSQKPNTFLFKGEKDFLKISSPWGKMVIDLGAMDSVLSLGIATQLKSTHFSFLGETIYRDSLGRSFEVPKVQYKQKIKLGGGELSHLSFLVKDLKELEGAKVVGILGLSFFQNQKWRLNWKKGTLELLDKKSRVTPPFFQLNSDFEGQVRAVEWTCSNGLGIRLDTGSQVWGDLGRFYVPDGVYAQLSRGESIPCGSLKLQGQWQRELSNNVLFDRGVGLNLGLPWLRQFEGLELDLVEGRLKLF